MLLNAGLAHATGPLPEGGQVVAGSASISRQAQTLTVQQSSPQLALDWQNFSVAAGHTVQFVQPSAQSVALNRVLGTEASVLQGSLLANGQVFLLNPNGILFAPGARVQVGGLLASTLTMDTADFLGGRYALSGPSTQAVVNQGLLQAANGGSVALVAARVENAGRIEAPQGQVLLAAGQRVRLDLGAPVPIEVEEGALSATIEQSGAIRADGGLVYLTAKAAGDLASAAINHSGITEARSLVGGQAGEIWLMGDMAHGSVKVDGRLDASAPDGGHGGFIETSAAQVHIADTAVVSTASTSGQTGRWLIDPSNYVIAATGGDMSGTQLNTALASNNVTILSSQGAGGSGGDILVNDALSWTSTHTLTLNAFRDIHINADVSATQGTLTLYYGQGAVNNSTSAVNPSRVHINDGAVVSLSAGNHFNTKLGSDGAETAWTVITTLGTAASSDDGTLQGINGRLAGNYVLGANIDASNTVNWNDGKGFMPLSGTNLSGTFSGRFDGLGHSISNLYINRPNDSWVGFIGINDPNGGAFTWSSFGRPTDNPQIANVRLLNVDITGGGTVGAIAGEFRSAMIVNVYASGSVQSTGNRIGGLTGNHKQSVILDSISEVNVVGSSGVGGLIGEFEGASYVTNSYASGTVSCPSGGWCDSAKVGGLVGNPGWGQGVVTNAYYNTAVNTDVNMRDRALYGKTPAEIKAAAAADWSAAVWDTSGSLPQLRRNTVIPVYQQPVAGNSDPDTQPPALNYTLAGLASPLSYNGGEQSLSGLWSAASIFGSGYSSWVPGTDYVFVYNANQVTGFTAAGVYGNITVRVLNSGYTVASSGNTAGSLSIHPAAITVQAGSASKVYGQADPSLGWQLSSGSLVGSDTLSGALSRATGESVGSYAITQGSLANPNYEINYLGSLLDIRPAAGRAVDHATAPIGLVQQTLAGALSAAGQAPSQAGAVRLGKGGAQTANPSPTGSGGLRLVAVSDTAEVGSQRRDGGNAGTSAGINAGIDAGINAGINAGTQAIDSLGYVQVFVVNGGLRLP
jgi:filamentous hemagglutinin family protein